MRGDKQLQVAYIYRDQSLIEPAILKEGLDYYIDVTAKHNQDKHVTKLVNLATVKEVSTIRGFALTESSGYAGCLKFDGVDDYIDLTELRTLSNPFTIEVVLRLKGDTEGTIYHIQTEHTTLVLYYTQGYINVVGQDSAGDFVSIGTAEVSLEMSDRVTVTLAVSGNTIKLYLDGELKDSQTTPILANVGAFLWGAIGVRVPDQGHYNGEFLAFRKYRKALTETEVTQNYNEDKVRWV